MPAIERTGPVAIVTGASRGIGAATARALAGSGYRVMLSARGRDGLRAVREAIRSAGGTAERFCCDVGDYRQVSQLIATTNELWGQIDVLINNAGTMEPIGHIFEVDPIAWYEHLRCNLAGPLNTCRAVLPGFIKSGAGVIINVSSGAASVPLAGWSAYCCSKAGLAMLTQVLHTEVAGRGVRVYGFKPGMVNTALTRSALKIKVNRLGELDPEGFSDPAEPARALVWLCSDAATDLAGQELDFNTPDFRRRLTAAAKPTT